MSIVVSFFHYMEQNFKDIEQRRISCMFGDFIRFCSR